MAIKLLRFSDLRIRGVAQNWPTLKRRIENDGFPRGRMIGANTRVWVEAEVEEWIKTRPTAGPAPRGAAKLRQDRARKAMHPDARG